MKKSQGWKLSKDSSTKMIVWFKDGNIRTMYSLDWKHKFSKIKDKRIGLTRFHVLIKKYGSLAGVIEIYDTNTGALIEKYFEGVEESIN